MKKKDRIKFIVYPLVVGLISIGCSIGLIFYYNSKSNSTIISYVMCAILACVGLACLISCVIQLISMFKYNAVSKNGIEQVAIFVSYETKTTVDKQAIYKVTIEYKNNDELKTFITPSEFTWQEVLALKCAKEFKIKYYKNKCILISNLNDMILQYSKEIAQEQSKYDEAYNKVQNVLNQKIDGIQERQVTVIEKRKEDDKIKEEDKEDALDDI